MLRRGVYHYETNKQLDSNGKLALKASYPYLEKQTKAFLNFIERRMLNNDKSFK